MTRRFGVLTAAFALLVQTTALALPESDRPAGQTRVTQLYDKGNRLFKARRYAEAEKSFLDALKLAPGISAIRHSLGLVYIQTQDHELAILHLEEALRIEPNQVKTLYALAKSYATVGESARARELYLRVIQLNPRFETAYQDLAGICYREKKAEEALEWLEKAREVNPKSAHTLMLIGVSGIRSGRTDIALDAVTELRKIGQPDRARRLEYLIFSSKEQSAASEDSKK